MASNNDMDICENLPSPDTMPVTHLVLPWVLELLRQRLSNELNGLIQSGDIPVSPGFVFTVTPDLKIEFAAVEEDLASLAGDDSFITPSSTPTPTPMNTPCTLPAAQNDRPSTPDVQMGERARDAPLGLGDWNLFQTVMDTYQNNGQHACWLTLRKEMAALPRNKSDIPVISMRQLHDKLEHYEAIAEADEIKANDLLSRLSSHNLAETFPSILKDAACLLRLAGMPVPPSIDVALLLRLLQNHVPQIKSPEWLAPTIHLLEDLHRFDVGNIHDIQDELPSIRSDLVGLKGSGSGWQGRNSFTFAFRQHLGYQLGINEPISPPIPMRY